MSQMLLPLLHLFLLRETGEQLSKTASVWFLGSWGPRNHQPWTGYFDVGNSAYKRRKMRNVPPTLEDSAIKAWGTTVFNKKPYQKPTQTFGSQVPLHHFGKMFLSFGLSFFERQQSLRTRDSHEKQSDFKGFSSRFQRIYMNLLIENSLWMW